jgi:SAM-dependent methyltransferase
LGFFLKPGRSRLFEETFLDPGGFRLLDLVYGFDPDDPTGKKKYEPQGPIDTYCWNSRAAKDTRLRFDIYKNEMLSHGRKYGKEGPFTIVSLGSGPGRDINDIILQLSAEGYDVSAICVDRNAEAVKLGRLVADKKGLNGKITYVHGDAVNFKDRIEPKSPVKIIIKEGLVDYLSNEKAEILFNNAYEVLSDGGVSLASNMYRAGRIKPLMVLTGWDRKMKYRDGEELGSFYNNGSRFDGVNISTAGRTHFIAAGYKNGSKPIPSLV